MSIVVISVLTLNVIVTYPAKVCVQVDGQHDLSEWASLSEGAVIAEYGSGRHRAEINVEL